MKQYDLSLPELSPSKPGDLVKGASLSNVTEEVSSLGWPNESQLANGPSSISSKYPSKGCLRYQYQSESLHIPYRRKSYTRKRVNFGQIQIHTHHMTMGDNPSVSSGIPMAIAWDAVAHESIGLEEYEKNRGPRRLRGEMIIPRMMRDDIARHSGCSRSEMRESTTITKRIQDQRRSSAKDIDFSALVGKIVCTVKRGKDAEFHPSQLADDRPVGK